MKCVIHFNAGGEGGQKLRTTNWWQNSFTVQQFLNLVDANEGMWLWKIVGADQNNLPKTFSIFGSLKDIVRNHDLKVELGGQKGNIIEYKNPKLIHGLLRIKS